MHSLRILDPREGDVLVEFEAPGVETKEAQESRTEAKKVFDRIMSKKMTVIAIDKAHEGQRVTKFDPAIKEMVAIPQLVGG